MIINRNLIVTIALASTAIAAPVAAQDVFQGPYVAVVAGTAKAHDSSDDRLVFDTNLDDQFGDTVNTSAGTNAFVDFCDGVAKTASPADGCKKDGSKFDFGVRLGYDGRPGGGKFLAGVLAEYQRSNARDSTSAYSSTPANYVFTREFDYAFNLRGRLGYVLDDRFMVYATGGASRVKIENSFSTTNAVNSFAEFNEKEKKWGWQGGAGAEIALTSSLTLGLEYLYSTYDFGKYAVAVGPGTAPPTNPFLLVNPAGTALRVSDDDFNIHAFRATANFHF